MVLNISSINFDNNFYFTMNQIHNHFSMNLFFVRLLSRKPSSIVRSCLALSFNYIFDFFKINFLMFLDCLDELISKINFKKLKNIYFNAFPSKNNCKKQLLPPS